MIDEQSSDLRQMSPPNATSEGDRPSVSPAGQIAGPHDLSLEQQIIYALKTCYDPEIPVSIYELGLIYDLQIDPSGDVRIRMTLTSPGCPVAGSLPQEVKTKVEAIPGVKSAQVELVWDPPWDRSRMSEVAMVELGLF